MAREILPQSRSSCSLSCNNGGELSLACDKTSTFPSGTSVKYVQALAPELLQMIELKNIWGYERNNGSKNEEKNFTAWRMNWLTWALEFESPCRQMEEK